MKGGDEGGREISLVSNVKIFSKLKFKKIKPCQNQCVDFIKINKITIIGQSEVDRKVSAKEGGVRMNRQMFLVVLKTEVDVLVEEAAGTGMGFVRCQCDRYRFSRGSFDSAVKISKKEL